MYSNNNKEILKRLSNLIAQNKELKDEVNKLKKLNKEIDNENYKLKQQLTEGEKNYNKYVRLDVATVLIVEFYGFSTITNKEYSQELIDELDNIFYKFNKIRKKYNVKRIRAIGDVYMCAGGIPLKNATNAIDIVLNALEMKRFIDNLKQEYDIKNKPFWSYKMGIHSGRVSAIVIGEKNKSYQLKGETVDIASRVKAIAYKGEIAMSAMTHVLVKDYFICKYKSMLPIKYQKDYEVYTVSRIRKSCSINRKGLEPNDVFRIRYMIRQFIDLQEYILDRLEKELPKYLYYHNAKHTIDVLSQVELIGIVEGVTDEELLLLKTAAVFHDMGQIRQSNGHEKISCEYAKNILPKYNYTKQEIKEITKIIMATQLPPNPKSLLEKIICDADLDYLGRSDFIPVSETLFKELSEQNIITDINEWNKIQINFLSSHQYFTETANKLREVNKQEQIARLKKLIKY